MPTIGQLPTLNQVDPADEVPLSHSGATQSVTVGTLLAGVQPAIQAPTGNLLGRVSAGAGGPEPVQPGLGLALQSGTLVANGADHAAYPLGSVFSPTDQAVLCSNGAPKLVELALLRGLFTAGENVSINSTGTISIGTSLDSQNYSITSLPTVTTIAQGDLVGISQGGADKSISYENFLGGQTIDEAQAAVLVSADDTMWVAQGSSTMVRQTFAAVWTWITTNLPTYKCPVIEITSSTNLDTTVHNGRILVCSQPVLLMPILVNMGPGFSCSVLNCSGSNVTFGSGILTSSGAGALLPGQSCTLQGITYSGGSFIYAAISSGSTSAVQGLPGIPTDLSLNNVTDNSIELSWSAPNFGGTVASYTAQYRVTGAVAWTISSSNFTSSNCTVVGLQAATSYDFSVFAANTIGIGPISNITTGVTSSATGTLPGQVSGLAASGPTDDSITLTWEAPDTGSIPVTYCIAYCVVGTTNWNSFASGVTSLSMTVTGLSSGTSYEFQVTASNSVGVGPSSSSVQQSTSASGNAVTSIVWNLMPSGTYTHGSGSIGVNAQVNPATAQIQFGFSVSSTVPPASWTVATNVTGSLWGTYVTTPDTPGTWYAWAEGIDGSALTVCSNSFTVT